METINSKITYPKFIQNRPSGKDKFSGGSQDRLSKSIAEHFRRNDSLNSDEIMPRIIGIEGGWGSGKSNVVKLLKTEYLKKYYFFEYDAWGHQEDLQRRSFLELLTSRLLQDKILEGKTTIKIKGGGTKGVTWEEKLKYLLARKTETVTEKYPRISNGMAAVALVAILTPIFTFIAFALKSEINALWFTFVSILISALPVIISLIVWRCAYKKDNKYGLSYLLAIYHDKIENDICYETISEDEPTVKEFKDWMQDISDDIAINSKNKLVVVYDNMDRLPADKVKELWSSIHTFFAEEGFENVWAIIPFDQDHLACAFGDTEKEKTKELTKYFIAKTFPIIYHVPEPVITDYRDIFETFFKEAFGETQNKHIDIINRIYRLKVPKANVRDIIVFVNELVAMKLQWEGNHISLLNMAIFILNKNLIMKTPVEQILSGNYLDILNKIIVNDSNLQAQISALTYGIDIQHAEQIPMTKYIESCIKNENGFDINKYAETNQLFDKILEEVIKSTDESLIDKAILCLGNLNRKNEKISKIWEDLSERKIKQPLTKQELPNEYKILLNNVDLEFQNRIISQFYSKIVSYNDSNGLKYYNALNDIENFITDNNFLCHLSVKDHVVDSKLFIDFVVSAGQNYKKYNIKTDPNFLDEYLAALLPDNFTISDFITIIKEDIEYNFDLLLLKVGSIFKTQDNINGKNVGVLFFLYRILTDKKPLPIELTAIKLQELQNELETEPARIETSGYYDVIALRLIQGKNISLIDNGNISKLAEIIEYYLSYGDLLTYNLSLNIPLLNEVVKYMTINNIGEDLSIINILPQFESIKSRLSVSDEQLLNRLSNWASQAPNEINKSNIQTLIPSATFYALTSTNFSKLSEYINIIVIEALQEITSEELYSQINNFDSYYWHIAISFLIKTNYLKELPTNIIEFGTKILNDVALDNQTLPLPGYFTIIIEKLDQKTTSPTIREIRDLFCNSKSNISESKFIFFEQWLRQQGSLLKRSSEVVDKILKPVIGNPNCRRLIFGNSEFYIKLIKDCGDGAYAFKQKIKELIAISPDSETVSFAKTIGIEINTEESK